MTYIPQKPKITIYVRLNIDPKSLDNLTRVLKELDVDPREWIIYLRQNLAEGTRTNLPVIVKEALKGTRLLGNVKIFLTLHSTIIYRPIEES